MGNNRMFTAILRKEIVVIRQTNAALPASDNRYRGIGIAWQVAQHFADGDGLDLTVGDARDHHPRDGPTKRRAHSEMVIKTVISFHRAKSIIYSKIFSSIGPEI